MADDLREAIARAIHGIVWSNQNLHCSFGPYDYLDDADAILALFAERGLAVVPWPLPVTDAMVCEADHAFWTVKPGSANMRRALEAAMIAAAKVTP